MYVQTSKTGTTSLYSKLHSTLLDKLSFENKNIIPLGDFKIDLLHYENDSQTRIFLDHMYSISQSPQITMPTRITPRS